MVHLLLTDYSMLKVACMSTHLRLSYDLRSGNRLHCMFIFVFFV